MLLLVIVLNSFILSTAILIQYDISEKMVTAGIVPGIIDKSPLLPLTIFYSNSTIVDGQEMNIAAVKSAPKVYWKSKELKFYTLIMFNPDAPSRNSSTFANVKHWLIGNIKNGDLNSADILAEYRLLRPRKGTGLHRYIFLVFEHKDKLDYGQEPRSPRRSSNFRLKWSLKKFMRKYGFARALAGNYFQAQTIV